jgi:NAD(P)-dependent dehydrogenase (short-subunit alcohol dehydrogenase family)
VARGARVALIGVEPDRLRALADDLGAAASWWEADVRDGTALQAAIDDAAQRLGGLDFVVANAGVAAYGTVRQADEKSFERVLDINVNGVFRTLKFATPHLERSRGHAVVIASAMSFTPLAGFSAYAASKAGVEMLALAYRQEVAHLGVTVGIIHPGFIDTDLVRGLDADLPSFQELRARLPYPGNVTTSVDQAAAAIVRGLARRRTRVYIPRAVGIANWAKAALSLPAARPLLRRLAGEEVPALERERSKHWDATTSLFQSPKAPRPQPLRPNRQRATPLLDSGNVEVVGVARSYWEMTYCTSSITKLYSKDAS